MPSRVDERPAAIPIRRYERPPFSYLPGKPLGDYFIHFDHAAGAGREDKFEIAGAAYRLRKSACFQRSDMTCLTCHDPHDIPRGEKRCNATWPSVRAATRARIARVCRTLRTSPQRHVSRLPYAQAPHRGRRSRRHDRSLHSAATTGRRPAGAAAEPRATSIAAKSRSTTRHSSRRRLRTSCIWPLRRFNREPTSPVASLDSSARSSKHRPTRPDIYYELARVRQNVELRRRRPLVRGGTHTRRHLRTSAQGAWHGRR